VSLAEDEQRAPGEVRGEAAAEALALAAASRSKADRFLDEQTEVAQAQAVLLRLQADDLRREDRLRHWSLRVHHISDVMKLAFEISLAFIVLAVAIGLGAMVWSATQDHDLVVDAFSVPQDMAQAGMTGAVLASRVLDRFAQMQADTVGTTQGAGSYRREGAEDVRVEIPDTGVSLGELNNSLRALLGHETHVSGDLVHSAKGLALTVRYGSGAGITAEGSDLDKLVETSAEHIYASALPDRYAEYLARHKRFAEAEAILPALAAHGSAQDRAVAYSTWASLYSFRGDMARAAQMGREAVRLDPENPVARAWLSAAESNLGHDEQAYLNAKASIDYWHGTAIAGLDADEVALLPVLFTAYRGEMDGDFSGALDAWRRLPATGWDGYDPAEHADDSAADHGLAQARTVAAAIPAKNHDGLANIDVPLTQFNIAWSAGDWPSAVRWAEKTEALLDTRPKDTPTQRVFLWPQWAYAMARTGDMTGAEALIAKTPSDCDICMRMRGKIAALTHDWSGAARDFAIVAARSPHTPYAETDWGEMLLRKGDFDGAIARFEAAHAIGPHFADPLEMWGEALTAKNRSDLALAKFEEANKYAPNWGRLHLKWGEALFYSGDKDGAKKQFAIASGLDLSAAEKTELASAEVRRG
jgi:tetratricopeptide (TPR) repeat protein